MRRTGPPLALVSVLLALAPASALAAHHHHRRKPPAAVQQVLNDCQRHNHLQGHYSISLLHQALRDMQTDTREYTICSVEIEDAIAALLSTSRPPPKSTAAVRNKIASTAPAALQQAQQAGQQPVNLGGAKIVAGAVQVNGSSFLAALPTPLLIVLIGLAALGAVPLGIRLRTIVQARRSR